MNVGRISNPDMMGEASKKESPEAIKKAVSEFEALFINQMMKTMRETVGKSELFHGGSGEDIYMSMLDMELSKSMAEAGGIGLGKVLLKQLSTDDRLELEDLRAPVRQPYQSPSVKEVEEGRAGKEAAVNPVEALKLPVSGKVSSRFGLRQDPFTGEMKFHHGIDIAAKEGTPIMSATAGTVIFSGTRPGYGNLVEVRDGNGVVTRYGHTQKNIVKQGDVVDAGATIAYVGSTGRSTGPHLHFEVVKEGVPVNPDHIFYG